MEQEPLRVEYEKMIDSLEILVSDFSEKEVLKINLATLLVYSRI